MIEKIARAILLSTALASTPAGLMSRAEAANVVETASAAGQFGTLLAAAQAAGLAGNLATTTPITVFAPTDAAFRKLPKGTVENLLRPENREQLRAILLYHVVPSQVRASDVPTRPIAVATLNPSAKLRVQRGNGRVNVNGVRVVKADIIADNGIIHVIDRVLMPGMR
jgi:uncharacterized surface protein with fasciclin (FAS1) repeats